MIRVVGSWFFTHPGSWGQKGTGSRNPDPDLEHCYRHSLCWLLTWLLPLPRPLPDSPSGRYLTCPIWPRPTGSALSSPMVIPGSEKRSQMARCLGMRRTNQLSTLMSGSCMCVCCVCVCVDSVQKFRNLQIALRVTAAVLMHGFPLPPPPPHT